MALTHNFVWHMQYTLRDRRRKTGFLGRMVRFHLSNGLVSMTGNLALMPLLAGVMRMPVVVANGAAILMCSAVNFVWGIGGCRVPGSRPERQQPVL